MGHLPCKQTRRTRVLVGNSKVKAIAGLGHESEANREDWRRNSLLKIVKRWVHCQGIKDSVSTI